MPLQLQVTNFETDLHEDVFLISLQRKLRINHSRDLTLTLGRHDELWEDHTYSIARAFDDADVITTMEDGVQRVEGRLELEDELVTQTAVIAASNKNSFLRNFFTAFTDKINAFSTAIKLGKVSKEVKNNVLSGMDLSAGDYLDVMIVSEGGSKTIIKIKKGTIDVFRQIATR